MHESEKWKWSRSVVSDSATPWTKACHKYVLIWLSSIKSFLDPEIMLFCWLYGSLTWNLQECTGLPCSHHFLTCFSLHNLLVRAFTHIPLKQTLSRSPEISKVPISIISSVLILFKLSKIHFTLNHSLPKTCFTLAFQIITPPGFLPITIVAPTPSPLDLYMLEYSQRWSSVSSLLHPESLLVFKTRGLNEISIYSIKYWFEIYTYAPVSIFSLYLPNYTHTYTHTSL